MTSGRACQSPAAPQGFSSPLDHVCKHVGFPNIAHPPTPTPPNPLLEWLLSRIACFKGHKARPKPSEQLWEAEDQARTLGYPSSAPTSAGLMRIKRRLVPPDNGSLPLNSSGRLVKVSPTDKTPSKQSIHTSFFGCFFFHYEEKMLESHSSRWTFFPFFPGDPRFGFFFINLKFTVGTCLQLFLTLLCIDVSLGSSLVWISSSSNLYFWKQQAGVLRRGGYRVTLTSPRASPPLSPSPSPRGGNHTCNETTGGC